MPVLFKDSFKVKGWTSGCGGLTLNLSLFPFFPLVPLFLVVFSSAPAAASGILIQNNSEPPPQDAARLTVPFPGPSARHAGSGPIRALQKPADVDSATVAIFRGLGALLFGCAAMSEIGITVSGFNVVDGQVCVCVGGGEEGRGGAGSGPDGDHYCWPPCVPNACAML